MLSVAEIMLIDVKEHNDQQKLNSINVKLNEPSYSPPSSLTVFSIANKHVPAAKSETINK